MTQGVKQTVIYRQYFLQSQGKNRLQVAIGRVHTMLVPLCACKYPGAALHFELGRMNILEYSIYMLDTRETVVLKFSPRGDRLAVTIKGD